MVFRQFVRAFYVRVEKKFAGGSLNRYAIVRKTARIFRNYLKSKTATIDGHFMYLDSEDSLRLSIHNGYDQFETNLIKQIVRPGDVVVDLGANIGYYSLIFARLVGNEGKVYAFEPESVNFELLQKNISHNKYKNVVLEQKAVSDEKGKHTLYLFEDNKAGNSIIKPKESEKLSTKTIITISLDEYFETQSKQVNFIKMDVEGAEGKAIQGMISILESSNNLILMTEFFPLMLNQSGYDPEEFLNLLQKIGFKILHMDQKSQKLIPIDIQTLSKKYSIKKENHANLLCFKNKIPEQLKQFY